MARPRPKVVTLTEAAAERVKAIMAETDKAYLRVGVKNGGCAGRNMSWNMPTRPSRWTRWSRIRA